MRYINYFRSGLGDQAKEIFLRARLPTEILGQIWNLVDTQRRGALDLIEFIIGMHLIQCRLNGSLETLPAVIPPALYTAAGTSSASPVHSLSERDYES